MYVTQLSCPKCSGVLDIFGDHAVGCAADGERIARHDRLRDTIFNCTQKAALAPVLEIRNILAQSNS